MSNETPRGRFVWHELMTTDSDAAKSFYTSLLGWSTEAWEGGPQPYSLWINGKDQLGGVMPLPEEARKAGAPPSWLAYVGTPNVDQTVSQAQELHAHVIRPATDIPAVGRFAILSDPQGAAFAVYSSSSQPARPEGPAQIGEFSWYELATTDPDAAIRFYQPLFGWEKIESHDMGPMGVYVIYGLGGKRFGGMFKKPAEMPGPSAFLLYVRVGDVAAKAARVKELGGQVLNGPMDVPGGDQIAQCLDPQGAAFALHQIGPR